MILKQYLYESCNNFNWNYIFKSVIIIYCINVIYSMSLSNNMGFEFATQVTMVDLKAIDYNTITCKIFFCYFNVIWF